LLTKTNVKHKLLNYALYRLRHKTFTKFQVTLLQVKKAESTRGEKIVTP